MKEITRKEILSVIQKHGEPTKNKLRQYLKYLNPDSTVKTTRILVKNGFKPIPGKSYPGCRRYYNETKGIVIKQRGTICGRKPALSCPTVERGCWIIQPLISQAKADEACRLLYRFKETANSDLGSNNCGYWKGVPVMFDW